MARPPNRRRYHSLIADLRTLALAAKREAITLEQAAAALRLTPLAASRRLSALVAAKALRRLARGVYFVVPQRERTDNPEHPANEACTIATQFPESYVGGWTAAGHWGLVTKYHRETFVVTSARVRQTRQKRAGLHLYLAHVPTELLTRPGLETYGLSLGRVSNPERTLVEALRAPGWIGGARELANAVEAYRTSGLWNPDRLCGALEEARDSTSLRRLGAISWERGLAMGEVLNNLAPPLAKGVIDLEPGLQKLGAINKRWQVRMNADLTPADDEEDYLDFEDELEVIRDRRALWGRS